MGTLSKAIGSHGAYICAREDLINFLVNKPKDITMQVINNLGQLIYTMDYAAFSGRFLNCRIHLTCDSFHMYFFLKFRNECKTEAGWVPKIPGVLLLDVLEFSGKISNFNCFCITLIENIEDGFGPCV